MGQKKRFEALSEEQLIRKIGKNGGKLLRERKTYKYENGPNPFFLFFQSYGNENGPDSYSQIPLSVS